MPATAGRVRMPANNRVHSSAALQTHGIWQSAIGYDPYAPDQKDKHGGVAANQTANNEQNAYDSFKGLLALARLTSSTADEARGACKKCGRVGHLTFQCRNFLTLTKEDAAAAAAAAAAAFERNRAGTKEEKDSDISNDEDDDSDEDESDSDEDSEMERVIAARMGKTVKTSKSGKGVHTKTHQSYKKSSSQHPKSKKARYSSSANGSDDDLSDSDEEKGKKIRRKSSKSFSKRRRSRKYNDLSCKEGDYSSDHEERRRRKRQRHNEKSGGSSKTKRSSSEVGTGNSHRDAEHSKSQGKSRNEDYLDEHGKKHKTKSDPGHEKEVGSYQKYEQDKDQRFLEEDYAVRDKVDRNKSSEKHGLKHICRSAGDY